MKDAKIVKYSREGLFTIWSSGVDGIFWWICYLDKMWLSYGDFQTLCLSFTVLKSFLNMEDYCLLGHYLKPNWFMRGREGGREKSFPTASSFLVSTLFDSLWVALGTLKMEVRCSTHLSTYDGKKIFAFYCWISSIQNVWEQFFQEVT